MILVNHFVCYWEVFIHVIPLKAIKYYPRFMGKKNPKFFQLPSGFEWIQRYSQDLPEYPLPLQLIKLDLLKRCSSWSKKQHREDKMPPLSTRLQAAQLAPTASAAAGSDRKGQARSWLEGACVPRQLGVLWRQNHFTQAFILVVQISAKFGGWF